MIYVIDYNNKKKWFKYYLNNNDVHFGNIVILLLWIYFTHLCVWLGLIYDLTMNVHIQKHLHCETWSRWPGSSGHQK